MAAGVEDPAGRVDPGVDEEPGGLLLVADAAAEEHFPQRAKEAVVREEFTVERAPLCEACERRCRFFLHNKADTLRQAGEAWLGDGAQAGKTGSREASIGG
jgi:hypothetical protein